MSNTNAADRGTTAKEAKKREIMLCGLVHDVKTDIPVPGMNEADRKCRPGIQTSLPSCKPDRDLALESIGIRKVPSESCRDRVAKSDGAWCGSTYTCVKVARPSGSQ